LPVDRPAQLGDAVLADILGTEGEETVVDRRGRQLVLDETNPPPGFAEAVAGMTAEETREFTLTYPDDYSEERLAGKAVQFRVTVAEVYEVVVPELDDEFAKTVGDYETLEELREAVAKRLERSMETEAREREADAALEALVSVSEVAYPAAALEDMLQSELRRFEAGLGRSSPNLAAYLRLSGQTMEQFREKMRPLAEQRLVQRLALIEYARSNALTLSDEELQQGLWDVAASSGERSQEVLEQFNDRRNLLSFYSDLVAQKALRHLAARLTGRPWEEGAGAADAEETVGDAAGDESTGPAASEAATDASAEAEGAQEASGVSDA